MSFMPRILLDRKVDNSSFDLTTKSMDFLCMTLVVGIGRKVGRGCFLDLEMEDAPTPGY